MEPVRTAVLDGPVFDFFTPIFSGSYAGGGDRALSTKGEVQNPDLDLAAFTYAVGTWNRTGEFEVMPAMTSIVKSAPSSQKWNGTLYMVGAPNAVAEPSEWAGTRDPSDNEGGPGGIYPLPQAVAPIHRDWPPEVTTSSVNENSMSYDVTSVVPFYSV